MKLKPYALALTLLLFIFGGIAVSDAFGLWQTKTNKVPGKVATASGVMENNPADIKGSYTLNDVSSLYQVPMEDLLAAFDLSKDKENIKCKDLEKEFEAAAEQGMEIGPPAIRLFVALYNQLPYELSDEYLPSTAVQLLKEKDSLNEEQITYLGEHTYVVGK